VDVKKDWRVESPSARFIQWKVTIPAGSLAKVDDVTINYLSKNVAPVIDEVVVQTGARFTSNTFMKPPTDTINVSLPSQSQSINLGTSQHFDQPMTAQKDKSGIAVRWAAHDDNDDDLVYSLYYRGDGETQWKLLKDQISDKYYSFDAALLPDGGYALRVAASDSPSHSPEDALNAQKESARFEVDTTPPRIDAFAAKVEGNHLRVTLTARDTFSAIKRAEYSVDAADWQFVEPVDHLSDSPTESYDFTAAIPHPPDRSSTAPKAADQGQLGGEHVVVVRVYDRFDNVGSAKIVVK
jgi:hypothetical protein